MSANFVRDSDLYLPIKASRAPQRRINGVRPVGSTYHDDVSPSTHTVHQGEKLRHNPMFHLTSHFFSLGSDGIQFVDEDDARSSLLRFLEDLAESSLGFAIELGHYLWSGNDIEVGVRLVGDSLGYECFAAARGAV